MPRESEPSAEQFDKDERNPPRNPPRDAVPDDGIDDTASLAGRISPLITKNASIKNK
jgi:hypothetical protein